MAFLTVLGVTEILQGLKEAHLNVMIPFSNDNTWLKISWYTNVVYEFITFDINLLKKC